MRTYASLFGGVIAVVLLFLYTITMGLMLTDVVACGQQPEAQRSSCSQYPDGSGATFVLSTVGGLVSALVVSELAVTEPGTDPTEKYFSGDVSPNVKRAVGVVAVLYLVVWTATGLLALVIGVMMFNGVNPTVSNAGTTWLGLAVAAGYSYFGIRAPQKTLDGQT